MLMQLLAFASLVGKTTDLESALDKLLPLNEAELRQHPTFQNSKHTMNCASGFCQRPRYTFAKKQPSGRSNVTYD